MLISSRNKTSKSLAAKSDLLDPKGHWQSPIKKQLKTPQITLHWKLPPASPSGADHLSFLVELSTWYGISITHQAPLPRMRRNQPYHRVHREQQTRAALRDSSRHCFSSHTRALTSKKCNRLVLIVKFSRQANQQCSGIKQLVSIMDDSSYWALNRRGTYKGFALAIKPLRC